MNEDQKPAPTERGTIGPPAPAEAPAGNARPTIESLFACKHYALVVGINDYAESIGKLSGAVADAHAVADVLSDPKRKDRFEVTLLTDGTDPQRNDGVATRANIKAAFAGLAAAIAEAPDARLLLYFAGHGISATASDEVGADTPGYFLPQDAKKGNVTSYLSMGGVRRRIDALKCHHLLLVLDCCFAGAFRWCATRAASPSPRRLYEERVRRYLRDSAWHVITSAAHDERALDSIDRKVMIAGTRDEEPPEPRGVHGARSPFAVGLVEALRGDADFAASIKDAPDGVITGSEMHVYIAERFRKWGEASQRSFQIPLFFHWPTREGNKGEFVFLNPASELRLERAVDLIAANNPYRGFEPYAYEPRGAAQPERRQRLFGRDALTKELVAKVKAEPIVAVLGASGSGKSSLVCAGVLPALEDEAWVVLPVVRPGEEPLKALRALALALDPEAPAGESLTDTVTRFFGQTGAARRVAVIDQLEELVTMRRGGDVRGEFFRAVEEAVAASDGGLRVVYTLRSDFEPHFARELLERNPGCRFRVTAMSQEELCAVIERPAEACVICFDPPALVDEIVREVIDAPGALPLLSFTLSEMYLSYTRAVGENTRDDRALTRKDYAALGGVEGSLGKQATRVYDALPDDATRLAMRRVMLRMVSLEGGQPARRRVLESELVYADADEAARATTALDALTKARLVVRGAEGDAAFAEPAHDKIVLGWPKLREWLGAEGERERMEALQLVREKTADWSRLGRKSGWLDRDTRLDWWAEILKDVLNAEEAQLLGESVARRREAAERKRRATWWLRAGVAASFAALATFAVYSTRQERRAVASRREAEHQTRVARDQTRLAERNEVVSSAGALLARESFHGAERENLADALVLRSRAKARHLPTLPAVDAALFQAVAAALNPIRFQGLVAGTGMSANHSVTPFTTTASFSPDGTRVVTMTRSSALRLWNARNGELVVTVGSDVPAGVMGRIFFTAPRARFSPDGACITTWSNSGLSTDPVDVGVMSAHDGALRCTLRGHTGPVRHVSFSPDGARIVTASADGTGRVWDVRTCATLATLTGHAGPLSHASFSPDGERVITASADGTARVWNARDGRPSWTLAHRPSADYAAFLPGRARIVTSGGGRVRLWDASDGALLRTLENQRVSARSPAPFPADGAHLLTTSSGTRIPYGTDPGGTRARVWDLRSDRPAVELAVVSDVDVLSHQPINVPTQDVWPASFSSDGELVVGVAGGAVRVWNAESGRLVDTLGEPGATLMTAAFSADGLGIATVSEDFAACVWDDHDGPVRWTLRVPAASYTIPKFSPDGAQITTTLSDGTHSVWDVRGRRLVPTPTMPAQPDAKFWFSPDGERIVTARDHTVHLWSAHGFTHVRSFEVADTETVVDVRFSASSVSVLALPYGGAGVDSNTYLPPRDPSYRPDPPRIWDASTGAILVTLRGVTRYVTSAFFSPDGARVTTFEHGQPYSGATGHRDWFTIAADERADAHVWSALDGTLLGSHTGPSITSADVFETVSRDGARAVTLTEGGTVHVWNAHDGRPLTGFEVGPSIPSLASLSPDGAFLLTGSYRTVRLWNARDGKALGTLDGVPGAFVFGAFSLDGARVVTTSDDGVARVWNTRDGMLLAVLRAIPRGQPGARCGSYAAFSPDGVHVTTSMRCVVRVWNLDPEVAAREGCDLLRDGPLWRARSDLRAACADVH